MKGGDNLKTTKDYASEKERGKGIGFERIRRITGYLVGDISRWNNAKQSEERDRVKHNLERSGNYDEERN